MLLWIWKKLSWKDPLPFERCTASNPWTDCYRQIAPCCVDGSLHLIEPKFWVYGAYGSDFFKNMHCNYILKKKTTEGFGWNGGWFFIQNNFTCIYSGLNYRFCENFKKIGPVEIVLALCPHSNHNMQGDIIFSKPLLSAHSTLKRTFPFETQ